MRKGLLFLAGGAAGAALPYFLDPDRGRARRVKTRDQVGAAVRRRRRRMEQAARRSEAEVYGAWQRAQAAGPEAPPPNDVTLARKVETELFASPDAPKGQVDVNVEDGVVVLRGQLDRPEQIQELEQAARRIPGVRDVRNLLHLPGTPPPNVADALEASERADMPGTGTAVE